MEPRRTTKQRRKDVRVSVVRQERGCGCRRRGQAAAGGVGDLRRKVERPRLLGPGRAVLGAAGGRAVTHQAAGAERGDPSKEFLYIS